MQAQLALVIASDPVLAALVATLAELAGIQVAFPQSGENPRSALLRTRPAFVIADCDQADTGSEAFVGPALMTGARLALMCSRTHFARERLQAIADRHGLAFFLMPDDADALQAWIVAAAASRREDALRHRA